jgi:hypothetical protein
MEEETSGVESSDASSSRDSDTTMSSQTSRTSSDDLSSNNGIDAQPSESSMRGGVGASNYNAEADGDYDDDGLAGTNVESEAEDEDSMIMIEDFFFTEDDVARRKQVSSMRKTTTGSKGKGGGRNKKPKFITTDWEMVLQSNSGMVTQTSSAGNIITMMGVTKKMNGGNADDDFNDFTIGASSGITSSVVTCVPVSLGAGKGQCRVPTGKRATNNKEMFNAPIKGQ